MKQIISILICAWFATTINAQSLSKEQLLQDYDYYFSQMELIHPDPYCAFGGKAGFDVAVKGLRNDLAGRDSLSLNDIEWHVPTQILYGSNDHLTSLETITDFAQKHNAVLTMDNGEHWFHTEDQMALMDNGIREMK